MPRQGLTKNDYFSPWQRIAYCCANYRLYYSYALRDMRALSIYCLYFAVPFPLLNLSPQPFFGSFFQGAIVLKIIIYLFPILVNYISGGMFFNTAYRFSQAQAPELAITGAMAIWSISYSLTSLLVGRFLTEKNAARLIIFAGGFICLSSLGFVIFPNLYLQYLWAALTGVGMAIYCTPFQVFMKTLGGNAASGVVYATAMYSASWSLGLAFGPFVFGILRWQIGFYVNAVIALLLSLGVVLVERFRSASGAVPAIAAAAVAEAAKQPEEVDYDRFRDYAWLGWVGACIGTTTITIIRTLEPKLTLELGVSKFHSGMILSLVSVMQVFWAFVWLRSRVWMYKPGPALLAGVSGVAGLLLYVKGSTLTTLYTASILYGSFSGFFYFTLVFFSLVHPSKSAKYLSVNEALVGIAGIAGAIGGGLLAQQTSLHTTFMACAAAVAVMTIHRVMVLAAKPYITGQDC